MRGARHDGMKGVGDIPTMGSLANARMSPQAAYMKVASLELEKRILSFIKEAAVSRRQQIERRCEQIDARIERIGRQETRLMEIASGKRHQRPTTRQTSSSGALSRLLRYGKR